MGLSKVIKQGPGRVKVVHQLDDQGNAYAEDVLVTSDVPGRLEYLESQDGKIGVFSFAFSPYDPQPEGLKFPEEEADAATG